MKTKNPPRQGISVEGELDKERTGCHLHLTEAKGMTGSSGSFTAIAAPAPALMLSLPPETKHHMMKKLIRASTVPRRSGLLRKCESNESKETSIINMPLTSMFLLFSFSQKNFP